MNKPSSEYFEYLNEYKTLHEQKSKFRGSSLISYIVPIKKLISDNKCKTLLDYGCGKALAYSDDYAEFEIKKPLPEYWELDSYTLYDPAYPKYSKEPTGKYDVVICTDVLEHIPEQDLDWVINKVVKYSNKIVFFNICTVPALKHFKEGKFKGQNLHISVFEDQWWIKKIGKIWESNKDVKIYLTLSTGDDTIIICFKKKGESDGNNSTDRTSDKTAG